MCGMSTGAGLSFPEELDTNNSISGLVLFNNSLYNLYSFVWKLVYLGKSFLSKIVYIKWKMVFFYIEHIKQYLLFSYPMNIINSEYSASLLVQILIERNI